ncbi:MAG: ATP-binding protein [Pseudonocardiaceae bacterium]
MNGQPQHLMAARRNRWWTVERLCSGGFSATLVVVLAVGVFVVVRAVVGRLTGGQPVTAAVLATGCVALLFLPLYLHVQRLVDRLLYGRRSTPYSVLADLTARSQATSTDTPDLAGVAEAIARGLGAHSCRLTIIRPGLQDRTYAWVDDDALGIDDHIALPIRLGDEHVGTIAVDRAAVAGFRAQRRHLLADIADSLGAILQLSRLGIELERQLRAALAHAEDIAASRRQAVAEMDSERRTIERNLHDGAQHHLVSLRMALGMVEHEIASGQLDQARDRLGQLATQIDTVEVVLAKTATGVSSIVLAERGLVAALNAELSGANPPIAVTAQGVQSGRRLPPDVAAAVYFCCLEAVNNARKHASGAAVAVHVCEVDGNLGFTVRDQGTGFTPQLHDGSLEAGPAGRGLRNINARIAAVGGKISITSTPGAGTTVEGSVPLPRDTRARPNTASKSPTTVRIVGEQVLLDQVRPVLREACDLYHGSPDGGRLRALASQLDEPVPAGLAGVIKARAALLTLDAVVRSAPLTGDRAMGLCYQLEQIRSSAHELTEMDLLDELRSGVLPLADDERQVAEQLLGAASVEPRARLGLAADADSGEVRQAAESQLAHWQRRATHPASTRAVRGAAEVLVHTCEHLLAQVGSARSD